MEENRLKLVDVSTHLFKLSLERRNDKVIGIDKSIDLLTKRQKDAIDMQNGIDITNGDMDSSSSQEDGHASSAILLGSSIAVKNAVRPIKLTEVKRLPPYTTWIFLDRYVKFARHIKVYFSVVLVCASMGHQTDMCFLLLLAVCLL